MSGKLISKNTFFFLVALLIVSTKLIFNLNGYRFISYGLDAPRTLAQVEETISTGKMPGDVSPRILTLIIATLEQRIGVSPQDALGWQMGVAVLVGLYIIYLLEKEIQPEGNLVGLGTLLYACSLTLFQASSSVIFTTIVGPLLAFFLVKYIHGKVRNYHLLVVYLMAFLLYPYFLFVIHVLAMIPVGFKVIALLEKRELNTAQTLFIFPALFPIVLWWYFIPDYFVSYASYHGWMIYLQRVFGLWLAPNLYPFSNYAMLAAMTLLLVLPLFLILASPVRLLGLLDKVRNWLRKHTVCTAIIFNQTKLVIHLALVLGTIGALLVLYDGAKMLSGATSFRELNKVDPNGLDSYLLLNNFISLEFWRAIFIPNLVLLLFTFFSFGLTVCSILRRVDKYALILLLSLVAPVYLYLVLGHIAIFQLIASSRGIVLTLPFLAILTSLGYKNVQYFRWTTILVVFLMLVFSFITNISPHESVNQAYLVVTDYARKYIKTADSLILSPTRLLPVESTEKYYALSFIPTKQRFYYQAQLNWLLDHTCPTSTTLRRQIAQGGYKYIFVEPGYSQDTFNTVAKAVRTKKLYSRENGWEYNTPQIYKIFTP